MTQETFPEIQAATAALEKQITITEAEIVQMKETMAGKKRLVRGCARRFPRSTRNLPARRRKRRQQ